MSSLWTGKDGSVTFGGVVRVSWHPAQAGGCSWSSSSAVLGLLTVLLTATWPHTGGRPAGQWSFLRTRAVLASQGGHLPGWVRPAPIAFWNTSPCCTWCTHTGLLQLLRQRGLPNSLHPVTRPSRDASSPCGGKPGCPSPGCVSAWETREPGGRVCKCLVDAREAPPHQPEGRSQSLCKAVSAARSSCGQHIWAQGQRELAVAVLA